MTECFILLNTPNSVNVKSVFDKDTTYSPWIYSEIACANKILLRNPKRIRPLNEGVCFASSVLGIIYDVDLETFINVTMQYFEDAGSAGEQGEELLDVLYEILNVH